MRGNPNGRPGADPMRRTAPEKIAALERYEKCQRDYRAKRRAAFVQAGLRTDGKPRKK